MRAGIQLAFFIAAPSLFSTAFAGIKSIFLAIAAGQPVEWNSFLTVTAVLLIFTCFFGRHFCGYACAFGSFGDAVYEGFSWIRMKCFHKKNETGSFRKNGSRASESQIYRTGTDPAFLPYRCIRKAYGNQPVGCFFHAHGRTAPEQQISGGNCAPGADHCGNVYTGKVFLPVSLSHGSGFCINANPSGCTVSEKP